MKFRTYLTILLVIAASAFATFPQDPAESPTPRHPLQDELDEAEMRSKIAVARKTEFDARFPKPNADALAATNNVSGELIEARMQAYKAMDQISAKIAANLKDTKHEITVAGKKQAVKIEKLYVFRDEDFAKVAAYWKLRQQLGIINAEYKLCVPTTNAGSPGAGLLASMAVDWMSLLKHDTTIAGKEFDIEDEAVWATLASRLAEKDIILANPFASGFEFMNLKALAASPLWNQLNAAEEYLQTTHCTTNPSPRPKAIIDAAFTKIKEDLGMVIPQPTPTPSAPSSNTDTTTNPATLAGKPDSDKKPEEQGAAKTGDEEKPEKEEKPKPAGGIDLWEYLRVERILVAMDEEKAYWIKVKNAKAGGNVRIKESPLIDIFRGGSTVKFSGGSIAYYYILDNTGSIVVSGVESAYMPYRKSGKIAR